MEVVELRRAKPADDPSIAAILDAARHDIPLKDTFLLPNILKWLSMQLPELDTWVIVSEGQVGAVAVVKGMDIAYLAASADHRRLGFSRKLVRHVKRLAAVKGWPALTAKATVANTKVITLLSSEGFTFDSAATANDPLPELHWQHYRWDAGNGRSSGQPKRRI